MTEEIRENYVFEFKHVPLPIRARSVPSLQDVCCRFAEGRENRGGGKERFRKVDVDKLLCRLLTLRREILLNGTDIRQYRYDEYPALFSAVFQDYRIFAFELGENVAAETDYPEEKAGRALENAGFGERLKTSEGRARIPSCSKTFPRTAWSCPAARARRWR